MLLLKALYLMLSVWDISFVGAIRMRWLQHWSRSWAPPEYRRLVAQQVSFLTLHPCRYYVATPLAFMSAAQRRHQLRLLQDGASVGLWVTSSLLQASLQLALFVAAVQPEALWDLIRFFRAIKG